jgi:hypothetical protein
VVGVTKEDDEAAIKLRLKVAKETAHMDVVCTQHKLKQGAMCCQDTLNTGLDNTAKKTCIGVKLKW